MKVCLERYVYGRKQTTGKLFVYDDKGNLLAHVYTLELPWLDNQRRVSCIPEGEYEVIKHHSPRFKKSFWVQDVPDRSEILIHKGNYYTDILGCILVGLGFKDINRDGLKDVTSSKKAVALLWDVLPTKFVLTIQNCSEMPEEYENTENTEETQEPTDETTEGPGGEIPEDDDEGEG